MDDVDKEELEQLGHHGISNRLRRSEEEMGTWGNFHPTTGSRSNSLRNDGYGTMQGQSARGDRLRLHPMVELLFGIVLTVFGVFLVRLVFTDPADNLPAQLKTWPTTIGTIIKSVAHVEGRTTQYSVIVQYKVDGKTYWFKESRVPVIIHLTEVKYDKENPGHYHRVPLKGEALNGILIAIFVLLIGLIPLSTAIEKLRSPVRHLRGLSYNPITSGLVLILTLTVAFLEYFLFYVSPGAQHNEAVNYNVADSVAPKLENDK